MSKIAERAFIANAIVFGGHDEFALTPDHFEDRLCSEVWREIMDASEISTLELSKKFGEAPLSKLIECAQAHSKMPELYKDIVDDHERRQFIREIELAKEMVSKGAPLEDVQSTLSGFSPSSSGVGAMTLAEGLREAYSEIEAISQGGKDCRLYIPTGIKSFDDVFFGLERGAYTVIAGRPSQGKTALATKIATEIALSEYNVLMLTLEMSRQSLVYRILSSYAGLDLQLLRKGAVKSPTAWSNLANGVQKLVGANLWIDDEPLMTAGKIAAKARRHKRIHGLDVLVIDYIGLVNGEGMGEKRHEQVSEISRRMASLSKELDCAVVVLCQLGRDVEKRVDKRPLMSDLRDSGSIEQDADVIMFVYRDEYYHPKPENRGIAEVIVSKNRNGPVHTVKLHFRHDTATFESFK